MTSRQKSANQHWWLAIWGKPVKEYVDESIIQEPLTKEELWKRQQSH